MHRITEIGDCIRGLAAFSDTEHAEVVEDDRVTSLAECNLQDAFQAIRTAAHKARCVLSLHYSSMMLLYSTINTSAIREARA